MNGMEIKNRLSGIGTMASASYTNQEIVDHLKDLQYAIAREVCGEDEGSRIRADVIVQAVEEKVNTLGLQDSDSFIIFKQDMQDISRKIALTISGMKGEAKGFRALKALEYDNDTYVLRNVCLHDGEGRTEIDALVVSPYGVFVIEMKNCRKTMTITKDGYFQKLDNPDYQYPLGERMCCKEILVREALGETLSVPVRSMLLLVNDADVIDDFGKVQLANRNTVVNKIRSYAKGFDGVLADEVCKMVAKIEASHEEAKYPCNLDCERIVDNLVALIDEIERAEQAKAHAQAPKREEAKRSPWASVAAGFAAGIAGCAIAIIGPAAMTALRASR